MSSSNKQLLLTGASGLVGRAAIPFLAAAGFRVRALVRVTPVDVDCVASCVPGDLLDPDSLLAALDGIDVVVHSAARMEGSREEVDQANRVGTHNLARLAAEVAVKRFVFISSGMVYREGAMHDADEGFPVGTRDAYGQSKIDAEAIARSHLNTRLTTLRLPSVYITGRCPFLEQLAGAVLHEELPLAGDGSMPIDLVHGDDLAASIVLAAQGHGRGQTYNVCGASRPSYRALIEVAAQALRVTPRWVRAAAPREAPSSDLAPSDRFADILYRVATLERTLSDRRARSELGYRPAKDWKKEVFAAIRAHAQ